MTDSPAEGEGGDAPALVDAAAPAGGQLSRLVRDRRTGLGLSFRALADRCVDPEDPEAGSRWVKSSLETLERGAMVNAPRIHLLRALAAGLDIPLARLQEAAGEQYLGITTVWNPSRQARTLVARYERLSAEDQQRVLDWLELWGSER